MTLRIYGFSLLSFVVAVYIQSTSAKVTKEMLCQSNVLMEDFIDFPNNYMWNVSPFVSPWWRVGLNDEYCVWRAHSLHMKAVKINFQDVYLDYTQLVVEGSSQHGGKWRRHAVLDGHNDNITLILPNYNYIRMYLKHDQGSFKAAISGMYCTLPDSIVTALRCTKGLSQNSECWFKCSDPHYLPASPHIAEFKATCTQYHVWSVGLESNCMSVVKLRKLCVENVKKKGETCSYEFDDILKLFPEEKVVVENTREAAFMLPVPDDSGPKVAMKKLRIPTKELCYKFCVKSQATKQFSKKCKTYRDILMASLREKLQEMKNCLTCRYGTPSYCNNVNVYV